MGGLHFPGNVPGVVPRQKVRWFEDRRAPVVMLFSSYQGLLSLQHRMRSHLSVPFVPASLTSSTG